MLRKMLISAAIAGTFCAFFSVGIDWVTNMLARGQVIALSFISGFLGSFVASVIRNWNGPDNG
ncbi:hypothetical protein HKCCE2091_18965 [Rhodobacterales bacterium HKCCE2091]|nr:hypothetical protein [Rhodobacterales bacterium HKCCE2091]